MSFLDQFPMNPTGDKLLEELRHFCQASAKARAGDDAEFRVSIRVGLWLLRHLPVSRDAVFDVISIVYQEFVQKHLSSVESVCIPYGRTVSKHFPPNFYLAAITYLPQNRYETTHSNLLMNSIPVSRQQRDGVISILDDEIDDFLKDIHSSFMNYLEDCGEIWSPILSSWALHLLGQLSTSNTNRPIFTRTQSVNEVITIWMGSKAIQSLLTITSRCLTCQDHSNTDSFISALLDTSAAHTPHFDWVLAHVGNTYPQTVVTEVLNLGLNNFSINPPIGSKLNSVAGILGHLATTHSREVQNAFDQMLLSVLSGVNPTAERFAIPYLLHLCSSSIPLLDVLMDSVLPKVKEDVLVGMQQMIHLWTQLHFGKQSQALIALVTHLILKSNRGPNALEILMNGCKTWTFLGDYARTLLKNFMVEISSLLYESSVSHKDLVKNFPCISALKDKADGLMKFLTDPDIQIARFAKQIIKLISFYEGEAVGVQALVQYLRFSQTDTQIWHMTDLIASLEMKHPKVLANALCTLIVESRILPVDDSQNHLRPWKTIFRVIKTEENKRSTLPMKIKCSEVIRENLTILSSLLDTRKQQFRMDEASYIIGILSHVSDLTFRVPFGTLIKVERCLVELLFRTLGTRNGTFERGEKIQQVSHISKLLSHLCTNTTQAIQNDSLRSLVQTCLNPDCRHLFQKMNKLTHGPILDDTLIDDDEFEPERFSMYVSLLQENQKRSASVSMNRTHSTSFHSGKLSKSNRGAATLGKPKVTILENEDHELNVNLFLSTIISVCMATPANGRDPAGGIEIKNGTVGQWLDPLMETESEVELGVNVEAMRKVALLLVEIVSPDVMFNGLPWPEEEFSKVQVERDLEIRRAFEEHAYLWDILELVAGYCPSLCYCSVLLRALMATFMAHWTSCQKARANLYPIQLKWTVRLINIMKVGQLIPPPLCHIGLVIVELKANELLALLRDIWWFMKIHVPIPTLFIKDVHSNRFVRDAEFSHVLPMYTERLRLALINNVETVGYLYPRLFPTQPQSMTALTARSETQYTCKEQR